MIRRLLSVFGDGIPLDLTVDDLVPQAWAVPEPEPCGNPQCKGTVTPPMTWCSETCHRTWLSQHYDLQRVFTVRPTTGEAA